MVEFIEGHWESLASYSRALDERKEETPSKQTIYGWSTRHKWMQAKRERQYQMVFEALAYCENKEIKELMQAKVKAGLMFVNKQIEFVTMIMDMVKNGQIEMKMDMSLSELINHIYRGLGMPTKESQSTPGTAIQINQFDEIKKRLDGHTPDSETLDATDFSGQIDIGEVEKVEDDEADQETPIE